MLFWAVIAVAQMEDYTYKIPLSGMAEEWHKVVLPNEVFGRSQSDLSDIRIFGITATDTIEAPYFWHNEEKKVISEEIVFKTLNVSHNEKGYYYTFELPTNVDINQVLLDIGQTNFDWKITLEGGQDLKEWFTIVENYRILAVKNEWTDYRFTKINFSDSRYRYLRLLIKSTEKPQLTATKILLNSEKQGFYDTHSIRSKKVTENKKEQQTIIELDLGIPLPVNRMAFSIGNTFDYYRSVSIEVLTDSVKTEKGWVFNYQTLGRGTLTSFEENELTFSSGNIAQRLRITIDNQDNQPLTVGEIEVIGQKYQLVTRVDTPAKYFLVYGNKNGRSPNYDVNFFKNKIDLAALQQLELGESVETGKKDTDAPTTSPLFENPLWLWLIMGVIIAVLGYFSVKMLKGSSN